jgi:two-component system response regulator MprA
MLVEDDHDVALVLADLLERFGFVVMRHADGARALSALRAGATPDLVLLDLMMPNMDGYRFRRAQREDPNLSRIPTIVITAQARPNLTELAPAACLRKPFEVETLVSEIERLIR